MRRIPASSSHRVRPEVPPHFIAFVRDGRMLVLRDDLRAQEPSIWMNLEALDCESMNGAGNRRGGFPIVVSDALTLFVRRARRGGLLAYFNRDLYFGLRRRLTHKITISTEARSRGIPVAEALGALIEPFAFGLERGAMITRAMAGMTLWEFLRIEDDPTVRSLVLEEARRAITLMHRGGLFHADLNLHNLFVTRSGERMTVVLLDLDKARFYHAPLDSKLQSQNLNRLRRSAKKLDPSNRVLNAEAIKMLTGD